MTRLTLESIAELAGVSRSTVSRVVNNHVSVRPEVRERVLAVIEQTGYQPDPAARRLAGQRANIIGLVIAEPAQSLFADPYFPRLIQGITQACNPQDLTLSLFLFHTKEEEANLYPKILHNNLFDGLIIAGMHVDDPLVSQLIENDIPFVSFGRANDDWDFCWVDVDGVHGMATAVRHLIAQGHRRLALLTWPIGSKEGSHREQGYHQALTEAGLTAEPALMMRGENSVQAGAEGFARLWSLPPSQRPTAVACVSDLMAIGAMNGAAAAGLAVGKEMAITGYDDTPMAEFLHPPLTSVRQPIPQVGEHVVNLLLQQINGEPIAKKGVVLSPELMIRASSQTIPPS